MNHKIPFNKPYISGNELTYIQQVIKSYKLSGHRQFTSKCHDLFQTQFGFRKVLLTTSCSDALEMAALLLNIKPGDEVILPSYNFVSSGNAFALRGATLKFADSLPNHPNIDPEEIKRLISPKTKAIVLVHYAGMACEMDSIMKLANEYDIPVVEDAAHAIDSTYKGKYLGSFGTLSTFSFHETKNIHCGEGGLLVINDPKLANRAEVIWEKGTNRSAFFRGEVDKYNWIDIGSSFLPSDYTAAFLYAQLENLDEIQYKRKQIWETYYKNLSPLSKVEGVELPYIPDNSMQNGHLFYLVCKSVTDRTRLISELKNNSIQAVFHYQALHESPYFHKKYEGNGNTLPNTKKYTNRLVRFPLFVELSLTQVEEICAITCEFYGAK